MLGLYFSGTGNSRYALEVFVKEYDETALIVSIEEESAAAKIAENNEIIISYSVQYSNIPKMLKDFIDKNKNLWHGKRIFVIATMGMFSGDGAGILARLVHKYGGCIIGGLHVRMPDSIADEKALKHSLEGNKELVRRARRKIEHAAQNTKKGEPPQEGLGFFSRMAGLFGQRLYFSRKTKRYTDKLKIDAEKCVGCGACIKACPMKNLYREGGAVKTKRQCTMCYRCINICPGQAITLLGKKVAVQGTIEKYL